MTFKRFLHLLILTSVVSPAISQAEPILVLNEFGYAEAIEGLDVGSTTYNVRFVWSSYNDLFLEDEQYSDGVAILDEMLSVINNDVSFGFLSSFNIYSEEFIEDNSFWLPTSLSANEATVVIGQCQSGFCGQVAWTGSFGGTISRDTAVTWAVLDPVEVPEPGTLALLGTGLAAIGFARRRKKA